MRLYFTAFDAAMYFIYSALLFTGLLIAAPYYLFQFRRYGPTLGERFGRLGEPRMRRCIWVHAVSVGEVKAVLRLLEALRAAYPNRPLALSTTTLAGQRLAREQAAADRIFYFPFDLPWTVRRALNAIDPEVVIIAETEIWPNFIRACSRRGTQVLMVNGRIADRSLGRYRWVRRWLKPVLGQYAVLGMQSELDRERIEFLGADPARVRIFGNLKYDALDRPAGLDHELGAFLAARQPLWIAASTASGEEEFILDAFSRLRARQPQLTLLLAPRKPERFDEVDALIHRKGFRSIRRTRLISEGDGNTEVILLDTIGELASTFAFASVVFMGGTLAPVGGHNILEPARFSKPIVFGPHMENSREVAALFITGNGAIQIAGPEALADAVGEILANPTMAAELGANAKRVVDRHTGATGRVIEFLQEMLNDKHR